MAAEMHTSVVRDRHVDYLLASTYIPALDVIKQGLPPSPGTLTAAFSIGSPTYVQINSSRHGGILLTALTPTIDYLWRVPHELDLHHPVYFRHHWTSAASGLTPTIAFAQYVATLSVATAMTSSPTAVMNVVIPSSSNGGAAGTAWTLNIAPRGSVQPIATGLSAYALMDDRVEFLHMAIQANSVNFTIAQNNVIWIGMDVEYTPRRTFGDGSRREGRKMETNLGHQEIGAANEY